MQKVETFEYWLQPIDVGHTGYFYEAGWRQPI
jgi:hypothetical protein